MLRSTVATGEWMCAAENPRIARRECLSFWFRSTVRACRLSPRLQGTRPCWVEPIQRLRPQRSPISKSDIRIVMVLSLRNCGSRTSDSSGSAVWKKLIQTVLNSSPIFGPYGESGHHFNAISEPHRDCDELHRLNGNMRTYATITAIRPRVPNRRCREISAKVARSMGRPNLIKRDYSR